MSQQDSSMHRPSIPVPFDLSFPPFDLVLCSPPDYQGPPALPPHLSLQLSNSSPSSEGSDTLGTPPNEPMYPHVPNGKRPASISNNDARKKVRNNGFPEEQSPSTDEDEVKAKSARGSRACIICRRQKKKCVVPEQGPPCKRCISGGHRCIFAELNRGNRSRGDEKQELLARRIETLENVLRSTGNASDMVSRSPSPSAQNADAQMMLGPSPSQPPVAYPQQALMTEGSLQTFTTTSLSSLLNILSELEALGASLVNENTLHRIRELLDLPEHLVIASEGSSSSDIKLLLEFILCLLRQGSLIHCDIQDANRKARKLMLKLISADAIPKSLFIIDVKTDFDPIAVGGFGRVFRGKYNGQNVALKLLDKGHRKKGSLSQDFCREALAWRSLSHRFVLPLLGIFESKSQLYLVSSFMANGTLSDWRKEQTPTVSELHRMMLEVAEGLLYIHSEGIVHGDLHGGNVLLDSDLHCQITDFGSTRHSEATVTQSTAALSLNFAAPELFGMCIKCGQFDCEGCYESREEQHRSKTMKTDVYAFGCLYYSTFFNTVPFHGSNDFQIIRFLMTGKQPHRLENPRMADNIWNPIQRCWNSIPSKRPTMEEIVGILTA